MTARTLSAELMRQPLLHLYASLMQLFRTPLFGPPVFFTTFFTTQA